LVRGTDRVGRLAARRFATHFVADEPRGRPR